MNRLFENAKQELQQIEETGLNGNNLETAYKLSSIAKNVLKIEKMEGEQMYDRYSDSYDGHGRRGGGYNAYIEGTYGRDYGRGGSGGRYGHHDNRMYDHLGRIEDGMDMYLYGRDRYYGGGDPNNMQEGLEKMMYGICTFVEAAMNNAETPEEKEIIRKHVQKMKNI